MASRALTQVKDRRPFLRGLTGAGAVLRMNGQGAGGAWPRLSCPSGVMGGDGTQDVTRFRVIDAVGDVAQAEHAHQPFIPVQNR